MKRLLLVIGIITFIVTLSRQSWAQSNQLVDNGAFTTSINFLNTGCSYNWVNSNPQIGLPARGTGNISPFKAINSGNNPIVAFVTALGAAGCPVITLNITVNPTVPVITITNPDITLNTVYGTLSAVGIFTVSGKYLRSGVEIKPPAGFEVSADGITFSNLIALNDDNADLSYINLNPDVARTTTTDNGTTTFTATVENSVEAINVRPVTASAAASVKINGVDLPGGASSGSISLNPGQNVIAITVTAQNGITTKNYALNITRAGSSDATLSNLSTDQGTISPTFTPGTLDYTTTVYNGAITVTPTVNNSGATVKVNGQVVAPGSTSGSISLQNGPNQVPVTVTAQDGVTVKTYNLTVINTKSSNAGLAQLITTPSYTLNRTLGTTNYVTTVPSGVNSLQLIAVASDANSVIKVNGIITASGTASAPVTLNSTGTTTITTTITAQDGITNQTYIITVNKSSLTNTSFARFTLLPFSYFTQIGNTRNYNVSVSSTLATVQLAATANDEQQVIKINGVLISSGEFSNPIPLNTTGTTSIAVGITAPNGTTTVTYTVIVNKKGSSNANLAKLSLTIPSTIGQALGTQNYTTSVSLDATSVQEIITTVDPNAKIKVNGVAATSGAPSQPIPLNATGTTTITNVVTAEDGLTTQTYSLIISKNGSSNTSVSNITLSPNSTLIQVPGTNDFTTSVAADVNSILQTITPQDKNATLRINGALASAGVASEAIPLNPTGTTTITTVIKAQDGVSSRTIKLIVSKNGSTNTAIRQISLTPAETLTPISQSAYLTSVAPSVNSVQLSVIPDDPNATVTVNGTAVRNGSASVPVLLNTTGSTVITTIVTAPDRVSAKTYTVTVNKNGSTNTDVSQLYLTPSVNLTAIDGTNNYIGSVTPAVTSVQQTIIPADANTTITVNGQPVIAGTASSPIPLNTNGSTIITTVVTAPDRFTTKTYIVTITKGSNNELLSPLTADLATTPIYARLAATAPAGTLNDKIIVTSSGADDAIINLVDCIVKPAPLTIGTNNVTKTYGTPLPDDNASDKFKIVAGALKNNNTVSAVALNYNAGADALAAVGKYPGAITLSNVLGSNGFLLANYEIVYAPGDVIVEPVLLTVTANNLTKDFGAVNPPLTLTYTGFVNNEEPENLLIQPTAYTNAITRSPIGEYVISVSNGLSPNYLFKYLAGVLTIGGEHLKIFVPNTFTPNGDGINDTWNIGDVDAYPNTTIEVFNRQGQKVFNSLGYGVPWDGTYKGLLLPPGSYYYLIKNNVNTMSGNLMIIR
ncbi:cadherin-like beta sandwich domain-containing protein [Mucilaginibacter sp.]|uniref:cadherin-like beta sandwich domain-containing protein n=1 Tax=Mucilaginibacter sp. TaxID=1882438 RepID=UPI0035BBF5B7